MTPPFSFHTGRQALVVSVDGQAPQAYPILLLRRLGWYVDELAMYRLPRFDERFVGGSPQARVR